MEKKRRIEKNKKRILKGTKINKIGTIKMKRKKKWGKI